MKLLLALLSPTSNVAAETALTALRLQAAAAEQGWSLQFRIAVGDHPDDNRDRVAADFLHADADALLLLRSDFAIEPDLVARMLDSGHLVVGSIHPRRGLSWSQVQVDGAPLDVERALLQALRFDGELELDAEGRFEVVDGFARAVRVSLDCVLVRRTAFDRLLAAGHDRMRLFSPSASPGEPPLDASAAFCRRWRAAGGALWADVVSPVTHVGRQVHRGAYVEHLRASAAAQVTAIDSGAPPGPPGNPSSAG